MHEKRNKKLKLDQTTNTESKNNQADLVANSNQIAKVNLRSLKMLVAPIIKSFANGISEFETFKTEMAKTEQYAENNNHILFAFLDALEIPHKNPSRKKEHEELVFCWFLDQVESKLNDLKTHYASTATKKEQAENLILKLTTYYSFYDKILAKPLLKQWIEEEFFIKLVLKFLSSNTPDSKNPLEFINKYFPSNGIHLLKNYTSNSRAFMDLILQHRFYDHILTFWDNGCRPHSQEVFNSNLFQKDYMWNRDTSKRVSDLVSLEKLYKTIISSDAYQDFLKFQDLENVHMLFINNAAVNKELYVCLQEKLKLSNIQHSALIESCTYNKDEAELMFAAHKSSELFEKKQFLIKSAGSLANVKVVKNIEISKEVRAKFMHNYQSYYLLQQCNKFKTIEPEQTLEQELFFNLLLSTITNNVKLCDDNVKQFITNIKNLYDFFKSSNVSHLQLIRTFLFAQLSVVVSAGAYQENIFTEVLAYIYKDIAHADIIALCTQYAQILEQLGSKFISIAYIQASYNDCITDFLSVLLHQTPDAVKESLFSKPDSDIIKSIAIFMRHKWHVRPEFVLQPQRDAIIRKEFLVIKKIDTKNDFIPKLIVNLLADENFNEHTQNDLLVQLNVETKDWVRYLSGTNDILSLLLQRLASNKFQTNVLIKNINLIINTMTEIPGCKIPKTFLEKLAPLSLNKSLRDSFNLEARTFIEELDNICIHLAEQTGQTKEYEDIKTEYLKKTNVDPATDTQAIHAAANHAYADKTYDDWKLKIPGGLNTGQTMQNIQGFINLLYQKVLNECNKVIREQYNNSIQNVLNIEDAQAAITALRGIFPLPKNPVPVIAQNSLKLAIGISLYIEKIINRSKIDPKNQDELNIKRDAIKLLNLISMIIYFTSDKDTSGLFNDKTEARKILVAELKDQVQTPSCDQGPFIRFLMALEIVCPSIKFPKINRRNIMFIINDFINRSYDEMGTASKIQLIKEIYSLLDEEEKEHKNLEGSFPEGSFKSFIEKFIESNKDRLELFTQKDITDFFTISHPLDFHKMIANDVNNYMEKLKQSVHQDATNTFFSENNQVNNNNNNNGNEVMPQLH